MVLVRDESQPTSIVVRILLRHESHDQASSSTLCSTTNPPRAVTVCRGGCDGRYPCRTVKLRQQQSFSHITNLAQTIKFSDTSLLIVQKLLTVQFNPYNMLI